MGSQEFILSGKIYEHGPSFYQQTCYIVAHIHSFQIFMEKTNKRTNTKQGRKKAQLSYYVGCISFCFRTCVLYVNQCMGFFGWLRRSRWADIPCLPGCCQPCWHSLQVSLNLTRVSFHWCSRPPRVLARNPVHPAHVIHLRLLLWDHVGPGLAALTGSPGSSDIAVPIAQAPRGVVASSAATRLM